jgi:hypothetical protein
MRFTSVVRGSLITILMLAAPRGAAAQDEPRGPARDAVRVFIDCQTSCDEEHFRREIEFVDYVRDRQDADVHVLITRQPTGAGGSQYDLEFIGRRRFAGTRDSLRFVTGETDTEQEAREGLTRTLALGLVPFAARSRRGRRLRIVFEPPDEGDEARDDDRDSWNYWVYRVSVSSFLDGESSSRFLNLFGNLSVSRVTDASKIRLNVNGSYSESRFDIDSTTTVTSVSRSYGGRGLFVLSLGPHWSAGVQGDITVSTFRNFDLALGFGPALEFNFFPYGESTHRQFRFLYSVGVDYYNYTEETIFNETSQALPAHSLEIAYEVNRPWGSADVTLVGSQFLSDPSKNRLTLRGSADVRLVRGLSLNLGGQISHIADQLNLPLGDLTDSDILLRERERATSFSYFTSIGFSFTFGSTFSEIVNPRFEG